MVGVYSLCQHRGRGTKTYRDVPAQTLRLSNSCGLSSKGAYKLGIERGYFQDTAFAENLFTAHDGWIR
ncbi:hypothetical protein PISMIDRAFT_389228 [Pisolithus microcarpus 441]|uniref:Uncharacterized protein n=1 Tax=Pisolithus microcarpus 441 TaxID=765257 RepID=A0A0C9ZLC2_9AGAM|nr:hypothetical protein PISMIDRAFT_389228 [Pisolithus microcarpus 441]